MQESNNFGSPLLFQIKFILSIEKKYKKKCIYKCVCISKEQFDPDPQD